MEWSGGPGESRGLSVASLMLVSDVCAGVGGGLLWNECFWAAIGFMEWL